MTITIEVPDERIYNLLCSANDGAIEYWIDTMDVTTGTEPHPPGLDVGVAALSGHAEIAPLTGGCWTITSGEDTPRTDTLDRVACNRGLQVMATKYPRHFADVMTENDDAVTADVFMQCALFGEIIYG
jgi:hypothetical protein